MKNAFDDPKILSKLLREQEKSAVARSALDALTEQKTGLGRSALDALSERKTGLGGSALDALSERKTGLGGSALDALSERKTGLGGSALDALSERKAEIPKLTTGVFEVNRGLSIYMSDALASATLANTSLSQMICGVSEADDWKKLVGGVSKDWLREMHFGSSKMLTAAAGAPLKSYLIDIARLSGQAEIALGTLLPERLDLALSISDEVKNSLMGTFVDFSRSYQNLWQSRESLPSNMLSSSPALFRLPAVEYYNGAILTKRLTGEEETDEDRETQDGIVLETREVLNEFLSTLNPKLIAMRDGARQALNSTNPDRVRHFSISLRELFTQVLDQLAPDHEVKEWTSLPEHYHNGNPKRKTRLLYICRFINQKPLVRFVEKDIDAAVEFMNLFQRGTHAVDAQYTPAQLTALEVRMDSTLRFIFEVSKQR
jgi:hypothetical protein